MTTYETTQVMKLLGASRATVKRLAHDGKLIIAEHGGIGMGSQTTYTAESVQAQANLQLARQLLETASPDKVRAVLKTLKG